MERIIGLFDTVRNNNSITSIKFRTTTGEYSFAPYKPDESSLQFTIDGSCVVFFGGFESGYISGIGVWNTPETNFTLRTDLVMSPAYGSLLNKRTWDDTPYLCGAHNLAPSHFLIWLRELNWTGPRFPPPPNLCMLLQGLHNVYPFDAAT